MPCRALISFLCGKGASSLQTWLDKCCTFDRNPSGFKKWRLYSWNWARYQRSWSLSLEFVVLWKFKYFRGVSLWRISTSIIKKCTVGKMMWNCVFIFIPFPDLDKNLRINKSGNDRFLWANISWFPLSIYFL